MSARTASSVPPSVPKSANSGSAYSGSAYSGLAKGVKRTGYSDSELGELSKLARVSNASPSTIQRNSIDRLINGMANDNTGFHAKL
jgi:hypothetical protein